MQSRGENRTDLSAPAHAVFQREDGACLAYAHTPGRAPTAVFLCGYASDMGGTKARFLEDRAKACGQSFLRFDYQGHGGSSGEFQEGSIGLWSEDARTLIENVTSGPLVLVGSSMGAWIMLIVALKLKGRIKGLIGVAAAPDFTEDLLGPSLDADQRRTLKREGVVRLPSRYADEPHIVTRHFLEDGRRHLVLRRPIPLKCPVRLIHGLDDTDVPWDTSLRLASALESGDVRLTLVKGGGHRLSEPRELELLNETLAELSGRAR